MSKCLAMHEVPVPLRVLAWLMLVSGVLGLLLIAVYWFRDGEFRATRLASAGTYTYAGYELRRGRREGLDSILLLHALLLALVVYGLMSARSAQLSTRFWIGSTWVLAVSAYLVYCRLRLPWQDEDAHSPGSYGDWLTNPDYRESVGAMFELRDEMLAEDREHPPDPEQLVEDLFENGDEHGISYITRLRLNQLGEAATPAVIAALGDARCRKANGDVLSVLLDQLPNPVPPEAAAALVGLLSVRRDPFERKQIARALASTASPAAIEPILAGLRDPEMASSWARGLTDAFRAGRQPAELCRSVQDPLRTLLEDPRAAANACAALAQLDPEAARSAVLTSVDLESYGHLQRIRAAVREGLDLPAEWLQRVVQDGIAARQWDWVGKLLPLVEISRTDLDSLLDVLTDEMSDHDGREAVVTALHELDRRFDDGVENRLRAAIELDGERISPAAAELLARRHGLPLGWIVDFEKPLTTNQRFACALWWMMSYTANGGMVKAMECLNDENFAALLPALEAIDAPEALDLWRRALVLGDGQVPTDYQARLEWIAAHYADIEAEVDALSSDYYDIDHRVEVRLQLFGIAHADELREALMERKEAFQGLYDDLYDDL